MKAFSGAAGWRDNDASFYVVAKTRARVMSEIDEFIEREAEEAVDGELYDSADEALDNLWYVGPFESTLEHELSELPERERREAKADFEASGIYYPSGS